MDSNLKALEDNLSETAEPQGKCDILLDIGNYCTVSGREDLALLNFRKCISLAKEHRLQDYNSFARHGICKLKNDDPTERHRNSLKFLKAALASQDVFQIILANEEKGRSYQINSFCTENLEERTGHLKSALHYFEKSLNSLELELQKPDFHAKREYSKKRAVVHYRIAAVYANLMKQEKAEEYWNLSNDYAEESGDKSLKYHLLTVKMDFSWVDSNYISNELVECAPFNKKGDALLEQSQAAIQHGCFEKAECALLKCLKLYTSQLDEKDRTLLDDRLVFVYRQLARMRITEDENCSRERKMKMFEAIADNAVLYGWPVRCPKMCLVAIRYYRKMFEHCSTNSEKILALQSLALTSREAEQFDNAINYWKQVIKLKEDGPEQMWLNKVLLLQDEILSQKYEKDYLERKLKKLVDGAPVNNNVHLQHLLEDFAKFLKKENDARADEYFERAAHFKKLAESEEDDSLDVEEPNDEFHIQDNQILAQYHDRLDKLQLKENFKLKSDGYGWTELHYAARDNDLNKMRKFIDRGLDVNVRCHAGFTPLSEAIVAGHREMVKLLLTAKANVNMQSKEGYRGEEGHRCLTPLMEACENRHFLIAQDLLQRGAIVSRTNSQGKTAVQMLEEKIGEIQDSATQEVLDIANALLCRMMTSLRNEAAPAHSNDGTEGNGNGSVEGAIKEEVVDAEEMGGATQPDPADSQEFQGKRRFADDVEATEHADERDAHGATREKRARFSSASRQRGDELSSEGSKEPKMEVDEDTNEEAPACEPAANHEDRPSTSTSTSTHNVDEKAEQLASFLASQANGLDKDAFARFQREIEEVVKKFAK